MASSMEKDKETVAIEEEGFSLELPAPSGWKKKVPFINSPSLFILGVKFESFGLFVCYEL